MCTPKNRIRSSYQIQPAANKRLGLIHFSCGRPVSAPSCRKHLPARFSGKPGCDNQQNCFETTPENRFTSAAVMDKSCKSKNKTFLPISFKTDDSIRVQWAGIVGIVKRTIVRIPTNYCCKNSDHFAHVYNSQNSD